MKKKMKRYLSLLLACGLMTLSLAGCGQSDEKQSTEKQTSEVQSQASSQADTTASSSETENVKQPVTTEPITISIMTQRHSNATNNAEDIWFFRYLEYWLGEQGYDVTIEVQQTTEPDQQISLMLGTDSLPDLVWGINLSTSNAVVYGAEESMILDWTPYINEETMPNLCRELEVDPNALIANTCIDGGVYGLPYLSSRSYGGPNLSFGMADRMYVNTKWLEECELEIPTNIDEFLDMLRTFKSEIKLESGDEVIPLLSNADFFEKYLWVCLGYYGCDMTKYGTWQSIKDGEVTFPVYTEDYRTFIEIMKTCYEEGLISQDYFTMDGTTMRGLTKAGVSGVACDYTLGNVPDFTDWVEIPPFVIGDNDDIAISLSTTYKVGSLWASADTEYPEVLALIADYLFSPEGATYYTYGPKEGEDPLGMLDGWYLKEDGTVTTKLVEDGTYEGMELYARQYVRSNDYVGKPTLASIYAKELSGVEVDITEYKITDHITGEEIVGVKKKEYSHDDADGHWRLVSLDAVEPYLTQIQLPTVYMTEEDSLTVSELKIVLEEHIISESAKFITGIRPTSEIDTFFEELKSMGMEEYISLYKEAYSTYMDSMFK